MKYEQANIDDLIPYINNAKKHSPEQIKKLASSIKEFGFVNPIIIDKANGLIAGHGRLEAAKLLQLKTVPVLRVGHLTEAQKKAYIIADNRLAEIGTSWDMDLLHLELEQIKELEFDLDPLGFDFPKGDEFVPKFGDDEDIQEPKKPEYKLIVTLPEEDEMQQLFDELKLKGYKVKAG